MTSRPDATVVFDMRSNHDTGVARYGRSLLAAAAAPAEAAGLRLVVVASPGQGHLARNAIGRPGRVGVHECPTREGFVRRSPWVRDVVKSEHADLYFTTHYTVDRCCPVPFVFTIHDLTRLRFPRLSYTDRSFAARFGAGELALLGRELGALTAWDAPATAAENLFTRYFRALNRYLVERAARVVAVSQATARDVQAVLGTPADRIALVPCGVDTAVFRKRPAPELRDVQDRLGVRGPYCLFVGLAHPNKRLPWLLEALLRHRDRMPADARLVAVGGHAERDVAARAVLQRLGGDDFAVWAGRVTDDDLACLYSGASALLTASLNEGNNLPPLEALACGCDVIATSIPPLRETLGPAAHFYNPASQDELAALAVRALSGRLAKAGAFAVPRWEESGRRLVQVLIRALEDARNSPSYWREAHARDEPPTARGAGPL